MSEFNAEVYIKTMALVVVIAIVLLIIEQL